MGGYEEMKCNKCNTENPENSKFCTNCGEPLQNVSGAYQQNFNNAPNNQQKEPFYKKTWFLVLMCIFIPPVGIALLWIQKKPVRKGIRIALTVFLCIYTIGLFGETETSIEKEQSIQTENEKDDSEKEVTKEQEKEIETIFYGEIGLNKDSYMGKEVAFSFKCGYATDYDNAEEITTDTNLCYGSVDVQFKEPQKITEGEYITVSGIIGEDHSSTALTNAVILKRGEEAQNNYNKELEKFRQSFYDSKLVSYDELLKYPDTYYNQKVKIELDITKVESDGTIFHGDITGIIPGTENKVVLYDYRDNREPRIQEGDRLTVYGVGNETVTVKVKDGSGFFADTVDEYDIPCLYVQYIEYR